MNIPVSSFIHNEFKKQLTWRKEEKKIAKSMRGTKYVLHTVFFSTLKKTWPMKNEGKKQNDYLKIKCNKKNQSHSNQNVLHRLHLHRTF